MFWNKKKNKLSEICVDPSGNLIEPVIDDDFSLRDLITLLSVGAHFIDSLIKLETIKKDPKNE